MDRSGCSLEMEPRTLNQGDINNAREAAMVIIQNKEPVEVSSIFTQDMKGLDQNGVVTKLDKFHELVQNKESWDCSPTNSEDLSAHPTKLREPLSSPF